MLGVVLVFVLEVQPSVDKFLYLSLNLVGLLFRSWIKPATHLVSYELGLQLLIHLD